VQGNTSGNPTGLESNFFAGSAEESKIKRVSKRGRLQPSVLFPAKNSLVAFKVDAVETDQENKQ
jgi:hypothetical protein